MHGDLVANEFAPCPFRLNDDPRYDGIIHLRGAMCMARMPSDPVLIFPQVARTLAHARCALKRSPMDFLPQLEVYRLKWSRAARARKEPAAARGAGHLVRFVTGT